MNPLIILRKTWPVFLILIITGLFFKKAIVQKQIILPADLMVNAYYPWRENKFGYGDGGSVSYKNSLLSDSFSQYYIWKKLVSDSFKSRQWPLWNPYAYSGYPLLGNLHSGALYPLNILLVLIPFNTGWNLFAITGVIFSTLFMYLFLISLDHPRESSLAGAISYGFCSYAISWLNFAPGIHTLIWLPLLLYIINLSFKKQNSSFLLLLVPVIFLVISVGYFQLTIYTLLLNISFFLFQLFTRNNINKSNILRKYFIVLILGALVSSVVLFPSLELILKTDRDIKHVSGINFGLAPLGNLITLFAVDFFGNPATGNYWGSLNYHERLIYPGVLLFLVFLWSTINIRKLKTRDKYFYLIGLCSLLMFFDTPFGKLIYWLKIPGLSASSAGRVSIIFIFSQATLLPTFLDHFRNYDKQRILKNYLLFSLLILVLITWQLWSNKADTLSLLVAIRNLIFPIVLFFSSAFIFLTLNKKKILYLMILALVVIDCFRFGWKYLPFSKPEYVFPDTKIINFLKQDKDIFRIEKEFGPILPPNTWTIYGLMSPSGYDPMSISDYIIQYNRDINKEKNKSDRYAEIHQYDAKTLGSYNVKYLLVLKRDKLGVIPGDNINYQINIQDWDKVFETNSVAILKNKFYTPRVFFLNDSNSSDILKIISYTPNTITLEYKITQDRNLVLLDTWYPGWLAKVNQSTVYVDKYHNIFRQILVPAGKGEIIFSYKPASFQIGLIISLIFSIFWLFWLFKNLFYKQNISP